MNQSIDNTPIPESILRALDAAQREAQRIQKRGFNAKHKYNYVRTGDAVEACRRAYNAQGLSMIITGASIVEMQGSVGTHSISGMLVHAETGDQYAICVEGAFQWGPGRPIDKAYHGALSTLEARLYRLPLSMVGEDDEGIEGAEDEPETAPAVRRPPPPATPKPPPNRPAPAPAPTIGEEVAAELETMSSESDAKAFRTVAARVGLDEDTAVGWAGRTPKGSKTADAKLGKLTAFSVALSDGSLGSLTEVLLDEIEQLKVRRIHPKKEAGNGKVWCDEIKSWYAAQVLG